MTSEKKYPKDTFQLNKILKSVLWSNLRRVKLKFVTLVPQGITSSLLTLVAKDTLLPW